MNHNALRLISWCIFYFFKLLYKKWNVGDNGSAVCHIFTKKESQVLAL